MPSVKYRYGFNGKEKDTEGMGGGGSTYDYGFRIYNPNIAKFLSVDPLVSKYVDFSPYHFATNSPIVFVDMDGLERYYSGDGSFIHQYGWSFKKKVVTNEIVADMMRKNPEQITEHFRNLYSSDAKPLDANELVHKNAIKMVKIGADMYKEKSKTEKDPIIKAAQLEAYSILMDFANGTGPYLRSYTLFDPFVQLLNKDNRLIREVVSDFEKMLKDSKKDACEYFASNSEFKGGYEFSPDHSIKEKGFIDGLVESFEEHKEAITENPINLVIGGMAYVMKPVFDASNNIKMYEITFSNISGKNSLLIHQATNSEHCGDYKNVPLSNKQQTITIEIYPEHYDVIKNELENKQ